MGTNGNNDLATRMKRYEQSYDFRVPPRTYVIVRLDGHGFSKYTKKMNKPFDNVFSDAMDFTAAGLCERFTPKFAYTQSDEISLILTDFENIEAQQIFDGKVQKICSLTAGVATARFNKYLMAKTVLNGKLMLFESDIMDFNMAEFDSRVYIIPDFREVYNYLVWRQQDCTRNSISMAAQSVYSHKDLEKKSSEMKQEMLFKKGINWNDYKTKYKRGTIIRKDVYEKDTPSGIVLRSKWSSVETPVFTQDKQFLYDMIPVIGV